MRLRVLLLGLLVSLLAVRAGPCEPDARTQRDERPARREREGRGSRDLHARERTGAARPGVGAVDAVAPDPNVPQQQFKFDYTGGWGKYHKADYWKRSRTCAGRTPGRRSSTPSPPARRPTAPTGRFRAGSASTPSAASARSFRSTWPGSCISRTGRSRSRRSRSPELDVRRAVPRAVRPTPLRGQAGPRLQDPDAEKSDRNARYVYIDTFNSAYGPGWRRDGAKVTHVPNGGFCYSFAPLARPPPGYPSVPTVSGQGERHRITAMGPGVTPDVQWEGAALGPYDPQAERCSTRSSTRSSPATRSAYRNGDPRVGDRLAPSFDGTGRGDGRSVAGRGLRQRRSDERARRRRRLGRG